MSPPRVLSVGQCGFDHGSISRFLGKQFGAEVVPASRHDDALAALRSGRFDLVLVNRIGDRDGARGLDLIRALKADEILADVPVMLVSNYRDAQSEAVALGALPGFGKAEIGGPRAVDALDSALGRLRSDRATARDPAQGLDWAGEGHHDGSGPG